MITPTTTVIENSPIEFILLGPQKGKESILVRSANAGLDLIGLANSHNFKEKEHIILLDRNILSFFTKRQLNVIKSRTFSDLDTTFDNRRAVYRFVWEGYCTRLLKDEINTFFDDALPVIRQSIIEQNANDIELNISGLILQCSLANQKRMRSRKMYLFILFFYLLVILGTVLFYFVQYRFL